MAPGRDCGPVVNPTPVICTWSRRRDSNPEPAVYKTAALPIELRRRGQGHTAEDPSAPGNDRVRDLGRSSERPAVVAAWSGRPEEVASGGSGRFAAASASALDRGIAFAGLRRGRPAAGRVAVAACGRSLDRAAPAASSPAVLAARRRFGLVGGGRRVGRVARRPAACVAGLRASRPPPSRSPARLGVDRRSRIGVLGGLGSPLRSSAASSAGPRVRRPARSTSRSGTAPGVARVGSRRSRWATAANSRIEPATAAFSEPIAPRIGIRTARSPDAGRPATGPDLRCRRRSRAVPADPPRARSAAPPPRRRRSGARECEGPPARRAGRRPGTAGGARRPLPTPSPLPA